MLKEISQNIKAKKRQIIVSVKKMEVAPATDIIVLFFKLLRRQYLRIFYGSKKEEVTHGRFRKSLIEKYHSAST